MTLFRREFRNPFELVVARRPDPLIKESVGPVKPTMNVGGIDYELHEDLRVRVPELIPEEKSDYYYSYSRITLPVREIPDSPEVVLRKAIRLCLEEEVLTDQIVEIMKLELVDFVMES